MQLIAHPIQVSLCYDMHNTRVHTACEGIRIADDHLIVTTGCIESIRGDISRNTREDSHGGACNRTILPVFLRRHPYMMCECELYTRSFCVNEPCRHRERRRAAILQA